MTNASSSGSEQQPNPEFSIRGQRVGLGQRVDRGSITNAQYETPNNPNHMGNPCLEALPAWLNVEDPVARLALLMEMTTHHPSDEELIIGRSKGALTRMALLYDVRKFFELLPQHVSLELLIRGALCEGLVGRNPLDRRFSDNVWSEIDASSQQKVKLPPPVVNSLGFLLCGGTGSGKTTAAQRIALLYPPVIRHTRYKDKRLIMTQVVWLFVEAPKDGSPSTLIKNIFTEFDDLLDENYVEKYIDKAKDKTYGGLKRNLLKVLANHCIGMMFIDEVQHFLEAKEKVQSDAGVMNTFVELVNALKVPIIMIGTYKAYSLFKHDARQGRRNVGCPPWEYMEYDEVNETDVGLRVPEG